MIKIMQFNIDDFQNIVQKSCLPIWGDNGPNKPSLVATSFLFFYADQYFFITAGHPFEFSEKDNTQLYLIDDNANKFYLQEYAKSFENTDLGVVILDRNTRKAFSRTMPVPINILASSTTIRYKYDNILFFGFPASKYNSAKDELKFVRVASRSAEKNTSNKHFYGEIQIKDIQMYENGECKNATLPNLQGMSGGPAFYFSKGIYPIFAGIGVQYVKNKKENKAQLEFINFLTFITCLDTIRNQPGFLYR